MARKGNRKPSIEERLKSYELVTTHLAILIARTNTLRDLNKLKENALTLFLSELPPP